MEQSLVLETEYRPQVFSSLVEQGLNEGQHKLAELVKQLVCKRSVDWFDRMDYVNDNRFLDPMLFAWLTDKSSSMSSAQVLYGLSEPELRPAEIRVHADESGNIHLPGIGMIKQEENNSYLQLGLDKSSGKIYLTKENGKHSFTFYPDKVIKPHGLIVYDQISPLFERFFTEEEAYESAPLKDFSTHQKSVTLALDKMSKLDPEIYRWVVYSTQAIQLYGAVLPNSFATLSAHGCAFSNVDSQSDFIFFCDDLSHQCGHIIFNAITFEKSDYLAVLPDTPMKDLNHRVDETRNIYVAYHGLFTYTLITRLLDRLLDHGDLSDSQEHHCLGRMAFYLGKFYIDLKDLNRKELYTPRGFDFYWVFQQAYEWIKNKYLDNVMDFDLSNQPYVFSIERFLESNPSSFISEA